MYKVIDTGVLKTVESWSLIVPLYDNDGKPFDRAVVDSILKEILLNYPGFTVTSILGYWKGSNQLFVDRNYQVLIDSVPDDTADSVKFFNKLKKELQERLVQEKVYVTKQDSKQELLSFDEFFEEVGVQVNSADLKREADHVAKRMAENITFIQQRLGYETSVLRRDTARKVIIWERKICGIKLLSEFEDTLPKNRVLLVREAVYEGHFDDPKTPRSRRPVPLGPKCVEILATLKPEAPDAESLVLHSGKGTPLDYRNLANRQLAPACKAVGLERIGWHSLRHENGTLLDSVGTPRGTVAAIFGHSSPEMTKNYVHSLPAGAREAVEKVEALLTGPKRTQIVENANLASPLIQ